jgi:hypothetical protein
MVYKPAMHRSDRRDKVIYKIFYFLTLLPGFVSKGLIV